MSYRSSSHIRVTAPAALTAGPGLPTSPPPLRAREIPSVRQVRIKNRFEIGFDSEQSAGYRNLAVNLRVVTGETKALGLETHVCEVQLLLVQMAAIKVRSVELPCLHHLELLSLLQSGLNLGGFSQRLVQVMARVLVLAPWCGALFAPSLRPLVVAAG